MKDIYRYLKDTKDEGIYYWWKQRRLGLVLFVTYPATNEDSNYDELSAKDLHHLDNAKLVGIVDSNYAGDVSHMKSVSGIVSIIAGGTVLYKTKYQDNIVGISTESEFAAASEVGKCILYTRSILDQINIPQDEATILYEDN